MNLQEIVEKLRASEMPVGVFSGAGVIILLLAIKGGKAASRAIYLLIALALFAAAVWWHLQRR
jgi:hypothetical protein